MVDDAWDRLAATALQFIATSQGDGSVTWASGRLPGVPMYLARDVAHDDLCSNADHPHLFAAYRELLETGRTDAAAVVARSPPSAVGRPPTTPALRFVFSEPPPDAWPDPGTLQPSSFGARAASRPEAARPLAGRRCGSPSRTATSSILTDRS